MTQEWMRGCLIFCGEGGRSTPDEQEEVFLERTCFWDWGLSHKAQLCGPWKEEPATARQWLKQRPYSGKEQAIHKEMKRIWLGTWLWAGQETKPWDNLKAKCGWNQSDTGVFGNEVFLPSCFHHPDQDRSCTGAGKLSVGNTDGKMWSVYCRISTGTAIHRDWNRAS